MSTALIDLRQEELWRNTARHRFSSLFSSPPWIEALARTYDMTISASARMRNGAVAAAVPFSHISDIRGRRIVCLPFSDYCDPLLEDASDWEVLIAPILALDAPVTLRCLHNGIAEQDSRFHRTGHALWHGVDLTRSQDELWAGLSGSARQNVRRAERNGITVREGRTLNDVRLFHQMHFQLRKSEYRLLAQPAAFFENLYIAFAPGDGITVLLAEAEGGPIAGIFLLEWNNTLYYKFNASFDQQLRPNDLLAWRAILLGQQRGLTRLDFGLSDADQAGLIRYKAKFANEVREIRFLRWRPAGYADGCGEQAARMLGHVTDLVTDPTVPDDITRAAGDHLYRFFC